MAAKKSLMGHWEPLPLDQLPSFAGPWSLVPALPWLGRAPALRQAVLGQKAVLARPGESAPILLLRLPRSCAALGDRRFTAEQVPGSKAWVLALQLGPESAPGLPCPPPDAARLNWGEGGWPEVHWNDMCLRSACSPWARDWAWAWVPTYGPICLRIYVQRSQAEIASWVESCCPGFWLAAPDGSLRSRLCEDYRMQQSEGFLGLTRGYLAPLSEQVEADYFLLLALSQGALGELEFDVFDGDYYRFVASGSSARSLGEYLHARARAGKKHRWNRFPKREPIDARASGIAACLSRLARAFGGECSDVGQLEQLLAELSPACMPRHITVLVSPETWDDLLFSRLAASQPRISFRWQFSPDLPHSSVTFSPGS